MEELRAAYHTLGCKLNFSETSTIGKMLRGRGVMPAGPEERPDIIVVNTCSVTEMADKKGRQLIRRLSREHPEATLVVTGCYAQLKPKEVSALEGVDIVLGNNEKLRISQYLDRWMETHAKVSQVTPWSDIREFAPSCERGDRTRYFLKVQDGCDYYCTYCTIPFARGRSRSGSVSEIVGIARGVAAEGGKEIVITGVNIGDFGRHPEYSTKEREDFFTLLRELDRVKGIERYRISSIEPNLLTEDIIHWIAEESRAVMPHFHIPLQAGSDAVLKLMNRRYDTSLFRSRIELIKKLMPYAFIGVDIIAGARGETGEEWLRGREFVESLPITRLHVFPYSERPGTKALQLAGAVSQETKHERVAELMEISERKHAAFIRDMIGSEAEVLWEAPRPGAKMMHGWTANYIRVEAPYRQELVNTVTKVTLTEDIVSAEQ